MEQNPGAEVAPRKVIPMRINNVIAVGACVLLGSVNLSLSAQGPKDLVAFLSSL